MILGRGKLGRSLANELRAAQVDVTLRAGRSRAGFERSRTTRCIFILAVPDAQIARVAEALAAQVGRADVVLHCAGARTREELTACAERGAATAGFHPLVSFASARKLPPLAGTSFVVAGDARAVRSARWLCRQLRSHCIVAPILGPAYHAAAALLANGSAALGFDAVRILCDLGVTQPDAERALAGLLASVAFNIRNVGLPEALTGPVARGDRATVRAHRAALGALSAAHRTAYAQIQPSIERCAKARTQRQK